jgi:SAM-dependent methyltransferase
MTKEGHEDLASYDRLGVGYQKVRRPDARLGRLIEEALGDAETVLNVGAGTGSYEPVGRQVVAIEPSAVMLAQHVGSHRIRGEAENLPFPDVSFDAAMAILTIHHWRDLLRGLREVKRVARRQVIFTWDPNHDRRLWIATEYVPAIIAMEASRFATVPRIVEALDAHTVDRFEIPYDFTDGFQAAFWRRPEAYLDPRIRAASSTFASLPSELVEPGIARLRRDLESGEWASEHSDLLGLDSADYGYRVIVAG